MSEVHFLGLNGWSRLLHSYTNSVHSTSIKVCAAKGSREALQCHTVKDCLAPDIFISTICPTLYGSPSTPTSQRKKMWPWEFKQNSQSLIFYWFVRLEVIYVSLKGGQGCSEMWPASRRSSFHQFCFPGAKRKSPHNLQGELSKRTCPLFLPSCFKPISQFDFQPVPLGRAEGEVARRHFSTLC